ncbi:HAMP domain-containing protein [Rubrobacter marinus]|uniref:Sensor-like histidine kinase SenX3 n=1 Tax=Rubrobacter marinus TaxID=2653852 RepID=A0A6G8PZ61_9ACTN|nr:ATP-binding protein [Rubrobacter marinus]QIN79519.1 HAMP domain-containing protein [Rubrobacter marinus]
MVSEKVRKGRSLPGRLSFRARVFAALVGISATTSLVIGLVLYYFAEDRLVAQERELLIQRSRTANAGAGVFLEGLRNPESGDLPAPDAYAEELVRSVADPTGLGVLYAGPDGEPLAARDGAGRPVSPERAYERLGLNGEVLERAEGSPRGEGRIVRLGGDGGGGAPRYVAVWPLLGTNETAQGVLVYDSPERGLEETLAFLRYGILGAIGTSVLLVGAASLILARQITRPLSDTRDAAIRVASGDYSFVPVRGNDELAEVARSFNFMAREVQHYVGEMRRQKGRLEAVLEASPEAVVATDASEKITMSNPAAERILGIDPAHDHGRPLEGLGAPKALLECLREATRTGAAVHEIEVGEKTYWAYAARMQDPKHAATDGDHGAVEGAPGGGAILAVRDITEYRSLERAKTAFVSDVSHELRTPLTTIQSALDLIERARERLDPLEHRALELADGELKRIRGMVEELLTLAQMDSRQYSLEVAPSDLDEVVRSAISGIESKAQRFGIELRYDPSDSSPHTTCVCDAQKIYQVLLNLLDNAIKYSDPGGRVRVYVLDGRDYVTVRVSDTGVGIPEEDLPQLFDRFYRVNKDRSRTTGGSGLGLAISKQIVDLHGGALAVRSTVGVGSTFDVRLPKSPVPRSASYAI